MKNAQPLITGELGYSAGKPVCLFCSTGRHDPNYLFSMPASMLNAVLNVLDEVFGENVLPEVGTTLSRDADKRAIKAAIESGVEVPGAKLVTDKTTLGRK